MPDDDVAEDRDEELRERYRELLEELRTIIPGVTVLLAFLLTAPFSSRFSDLDDLGRDTYAAAVLGVAVAVIVFWTPAAFHRLTEHHEREMRLRMSVKAVVFGMATLAVSLAAAVFVVVRFVFGSTTTGAVFAGIPSALVLLLWYVLPTVSDRRARRRRARS